MKITAQQLRHVVKKKLLIEYNTARRYSPPYNYGDFDYQPIYRGMLVTFPSSLSKEIIKMMRYGEHSDEKWAQPAGKKGTKWSGGILGRSIISTFKGGAVGSNWTLAPHVAEAFAKTYVSKGRHNTFSVILQAKYNQAGFRPAEGLIFGDEDELRMPAHTSIEIISISVYNHSHRKGDSAEWSWIFLDKDSPIITPSGFDKVVSTTQEELATSWEKAAKEKK